MSVCFTICLTCGHNENNSISPICSKCGSINVDIHIELPEKEQSDGQESDE